MSTQTNKQLVPAGAITQFTGALELKMSPEEALQALTHSVLKTAKTEEILAFLFVCAKYKLNPFLKEIYAFRGQGKDAPISPVVGIDGWMNLANQHEAFDGMETEEILDDAGQLLAVTCRVYRKDRRHPITVTEYLAECKRDAEPWRRWPRRMLRHKAVIQALRYAFGFSGIYDQDEAERRDEALHIGRGSTQAEAPKLEAANAEAADVTLRDMPDEVFRLWLAKAQGQADLTLEKIVMAAEDKGFFLSHEQLAGFQEQINQNQQSTEAAA